MAFTTFSFLLFLFAALCVFYFLPQKYRKYWILAASYYFYSSSSIKLVLVLFAVTVISYMGGWCIHRSKQHKHFLFLAFFGLDISILIAFKYLSFLLSTINRLTAALSLSSPITVPDIIVPVGLSFIIFQSGTYLGDIYKQKIQPCSFVNYALFTSYFPTLLCGPIQKSRDLLPQLEFDRKVEPQEFRAGLLLIGYGLWIKFFVADALAKMIDPIFNNYADYYGVYYLFAAIGFSIQIYADFSSYTDIARGISKLLGINVVKNFNAPYLARNLFGFWRNWHMSLNAWFVEYIYIPLGGNRKGEVRKYINTMIVFLMSGLWHGASWSYIAWGGVNGVLQIVGEATRAAREKFRSRLGIKNDSFFLCWFQRGCVFAMITFTWIFFRMQSLSAAGHVIREIFKFNFIRLVDANVYSAFGTTPTILLMLLFIAVFAGIQTMRREDGRLYEAYLAEPCVVQTAVITVLFLFLIVGFCGTITQTNTSFIYFQF